MIKDITTGLGRAQREYTFLFKYNDVWMTDKQLVKYTKDIWTDVKTNATKYRILADRRRWREVPFAAEGEAVGSFDKYLITSNGEILSNTYFDSIHINMLSARLTVDGRRDAYYVSDLLYHAFVDEGYDPRERNTWMIGNFYEYAKDNIANLELIELKSNEKEEKKKEEVHSTSPQKVESKPNFSTVSGETYLASTSSSVNKTAALLFGNDKH